MKKFLYFVFYICIANSSLFALRNYTSSNTETLNNLEKIRGGVVQIFAHSSNINLLEPHVSPKQEEGRGSGFFVDPKIVGKKGCVLTNYHVVEGIDNNVKIEMQAPDGGREKYYLLKESVWPGRDAALLRLPEPELERYEAEVGKISYLTFGDSDSIKETTEVFALGYPLGMQTLTITKGCVSGRQSVYGHFYIQIDAPINHGNSGGPSVNSKGEVIGINTAGPEKMLAEGIGWIIPIKDIEKALPILTEVKLLRDPFLGAEFGVANPDMVKYLGNPMPGGLYTFRIFEKSMLDKAGMKPGDMLYKINEFDVDRYGQVKVPWSTDKISIFDLVNRFSKDDILDFIVYRAGEEIKFSHKLEELVLPIRRIFPEFEKPEYEIIGGIEVCQLCVNHVDYLKKYVPGLRKYYDIQNSYKPLLIIVNVFSHSQAAKSQSLGIGTIIKEVNGQKVRTLSDFRQAAKKSLDTGFFTLKSTEGRLMVLAIDKVLYDEEWLSQVHVYPKTKVILELEEEIIKRAQGVQAQDNVEDIVFLAEEA